MNGAIFICIGPMFSGKTTWLRGKLLREVAVGNKCLYINTSKDTRSDTDVSTHDPEYNKKSSVYSTLKTLYLSDVDVTSYVCIGVDEAQFFHDIYMVVEWAEKLHKRVYVVGLDGTSDRKPFGSILDMIPYADKVKKLSARCRDCQSEFNSIWSDRSFDIAAPFTKRLVHNSEIELIGGEDVYKPVCRRHYLS